MLIPHEAIDSIKLSFQEKASLKKAFLSDEPANLVFIGKNALNVVHQLANIFSYPIHDIDDYDYLTPNCKCIRIVKNRFCNYDDKVIQIYVENDDNNTEIQACADHVVRLL